MSSKNLTDNHIRLDLIYRSLFWIHFDWMIGCKIAVPWPACAWKWIFDSGQQQQLQQQHQYGWDKFKGHYRHHLFHTKYNNYSIVTLLMGSVHLSGALNRRLVACLTNNIYSINKLFFDSLSTSINSSGSYEATGSNFPLFQSSALCPQIMFWLIFLSCVCLSSPSDNVSSSHNRSGKPPAINRLPFPLRFRGQNIIPTLGSFK